MIRIYIKQAWRLLRENPILSIISVLGTALAVCLILVMTMAYEVQNAPYPPESNRDRMLFVSKMGCAEKGATHSSSHGLMSYDYGKKAFKALKTPEAVSLAAHPYTTTASISGSKDVINIERKPTDAEFWRMFDFDFIEGSGYTPADVASSLAKAVICESVARKLYGTSNVVGREILIEYIPYTITGVVRDVSTIYKTAYADAWVNITSLEQDTGWGGIMGNIEAYILARSADDFDTIRQEVESLRLQCNAENPTHDAYYLNQPDTQFVSLHRKWANQAPDIPAVIRQMILSLVIILLVPAINLSSMTGSRMRKRLAELGVRRAFGAKRRQLLHQVLVENLLLTTIGTLVGLLFALASTYLFRGLIYGGTAYELSSGMINIDLMSLINPTIIATTFALCLVLNLLSALIPALRVSRHNIVQALHTK